VSNTHGRFRSIHLGAVRARNHGAGFFRYSAIRGLERVFHPGVRSGSPDVVDFRRGAESLDSPLEELRLLSNVNSEEDVALQILLVGQPELREKMARPELKQFAQRGCRRFPSFSRWTSKRRNSTFATD